MTATTCQPAAGRQLCALPGLTAGHAQALAACLQSALHDGLPVAFEAVDEVDLAGVQLVLAYARDCAAAGRLAFDGPLPEPLRQALALTGCLNPSHEIDRELLS